MADVVPLTGENRILVRHGLESLSVVKNEGLRALLKVAGPERRQRSIGGTGCIPGSSAHQRGRPDGHRERRHRTIAGTVDPERAAALAVQLDALNTERRGAEGRIVQPILRSA